MNIGALIDSFSPEKQAIAQAQLGIRRCEYCESHFRAAPGVVLCGECKEWERLMGPQHVVVKPWRTAE